MSDAELLAFVAFGGKNKRALGHARRLLGKETFATLYRVKRMDGLDATAVSKVEAAMELARRSFDLQRGARLPNPHEVSQFLRSRYAHQPHETFGVILLDSQNRVLECEELFSGGPVGSLVSVNQLLRRCIARNSTRVIVFHNHPSGNPKPSQTDLELTQNLAKALALIEVDLLDHIVIGDEVFSFLDHNLL